MLGYCCFEGQAAAEGRRHIPGSKLGDGAEYTSLAGEESTSTKVTMEQPVTPATRHSRRYHSKIERDMRRR